MSIQNDVQYQRIRNTQGFVPASDPFSNTPVKKFTGDEIKQAMLGNLKLAGPEWLAILSQELKNTRNCSLTEQKNLNGKKFSEVAAYFAQKWGIPTVQLKEPKDVIAGLWLNSGELCPWDVKELQTVGKNFGQSLHDLATLFIQLKDHGKTIDENTLSLAMKFIKDNPSEKNNIKKIVAYIEKNAPTLNELPSESEGPDEDSPSLMTADHYLRVQVFVYDPIITSLNHKKSSVREVIDTVNDQTAELNKVIEKKKHEANKMFEEQQTDKQIVTRVLDKNDLQLSLLRKATMSVFLGPKDRDAMEAKKRDLRLAAYNEIEIQRGLRGVSSGVSATC